MDLLKGALAFIAWLSGSLAAIAGILYAFGYLATLSNLHLLGLDPLILSFDPQFYLQRGSRFTLYVVRLIFKILLDPLLILVVLAVFGLLIYRIWRERPILRKLEEGLKGLVRKISTWNSLFYALLLLVMLLHMLPTYGNLTNILNISNLLFEPAGSGAGAYDEETRAIRDALVQRDDGGMASGILRTKFLFSLFFFLEAALVFYLAWSVASGWRLKILMVSPFAFVLAMFLVSLPMIYGIIVLPNKYSTVRISPTDAQSGITGEFYLLNKTSQAFLLWDERGERILWLPFKAVETARIGRGSPLPLAGNRNRP